MGEVRPEVVRIAADLEIPLYPRTLLRAVAGRSRVRAVRLGSRGSGPLFSVGADAVILAHRRLPETELLASAGTDRIWRAETAASYPVVEDDGRTGIPGLYAVGTVAGAVAGASPESGRRAAGAIAGANGGRPDPIPRVRAEGGSDLDGYYRELLAGPRRGPWIACRCQDLLLSNLARAARETHGDLEAVVARTGLGSGHCGGAYCVPDARLVVPILAGRPPADLP